MAKENLEEIEDSDSKNSKKERFELEIDQLEEYFLKKRKSFSIRTRAEGTDFQKKVFKKMANINYGDVLTYKELAEKIGHPKAYRAVGSTCGVNRIPIIIPCHRVIKSNGDLGGYSAKGGVKKKRILLSQEIGYSICTNARSWILPKHITSCKHFAIRGN